MLLESWDVIFLSLKVRIPSGREYCIEPREYRKINFNHYHLEIVYFFFIKLLIQFKIFYGHNSFHLDNPDPVEEEPIPNPNPTISQYLAGLDSKIRILYTTAPCTSGSDMTLRQSVRRKTAKSDPARFPVFGSVWLGYFSSLWGKISQACSWKHNLSNSTKKSHLMIFVSGDLQAGRSPKLENNFACWQWQ